MKQEQTLVQRVNGVEIFFDPDIRKYSAVINGQRRTSATKRYLEKLIINVVPEVPVIVVETAGPFYRWRKQCVVGFEDGRFRFSDGHLQTKTERVVNYSKVLWEQLTVDDEALHTMFVERRELIQALPEVKGTHTQGPHALKVAQ